MEGEGRAGEGKGEGEGDAIAEMVERGEDRERKFLK